MTWLKDCVLITLIIGFLFGATLGQYPLDVPDGARYAEVPREMVASGDYITPHLNGIKYLEKPPLFYWMQAASIKAFGANEIAVSIVNALMAFFTALLIYFTTRKLFDRTSGLIASFMFASCCLIFALTRIVTLDITLTFFLTASLSSFLLASRLQDGISRNLYLWSMYFFAALAVMTKGLVGAVFPILIILIWTAIYGKWREIKTYKIISGTCIFLLITLPWHILIQIKNPEFFHFYFFEQHFLRYLTHYAGRMQSAWFLPAVLLGGLYPWIIFLPQSLMHHAPRNLAQWQQNKTTVFLFIWAITIYVFYSFSDSKLIPYVLPSMPPLIMLMGSYLAAHLHTKPNKPILLGFYALFILNIVLGLVALTAIFKLDFSQHVITKQNLAASVLVLFTSGAASLFLCKKNNLMSAFLAIFITSSILWLYFSPIITTINRQSIKPLITVMQQKLNKDDLVICYGNYYQDLPFYLKKKVLVAEYAGELEFGMLHQDTRSWMINKKTFWELWHTSRKIYLITSTEHYQKLHDEMQGDMRIIAKNFDDLLVLNTK